MITMNDTMFNGNLVTSNRILYTPSSFAKTSLLHLQEIGTLQAKKQHTSKRSNLDSYLFFIVEQGSGILEYGKEQYVLNPGDCVFIDCRSPYSHYTSKTNIWSLCWTHFYGSNMSNIYNKYIERGGRPSFHPEDIGTFSTLLHDLYSIAGSTDYIRDMLIHEKLSSLLTLIMKESWHPETAKQSSPKKKDLENIKDYLDTNFKMHISLTALADMFFINKYYLTRIFKQQYGCSIHNYLLEKRITHAKQLLRFTDDSIETICRDCGIDDVNYFTRVFKKVEGMTPGVYRRRW